MPTSYDVRLLQKKQVAEGTMEFTMEKPKGFEYRAGQYGDMVLPASTGLTGDNNKHGFSFVSAPFEDTLRMATRMRACSALQAGGGEGAGWHHDPAAGAVGRLHPAEK